MRSSCHLAKGAPRPSLGVSMSLTLILPGANLALLSSARHCPLPCAVWRLTPCPVLFDLKPQPCLEIINAGLICRRLYLSLPNPVNSIRDLKFKGALPFGSAPFISTSFSALSDVLQKRRAFFKRDHSRHIPAKAPGNFQTVFSNIKSHFDCSRSTACFPCAAALFARICNFRRAAWHRVPQRPE